MSKKITCIVIIASIISTLLSVIILRWNEYNILDRGAGINEGVVNINKENTISQEIYIDHTSYIEIATCIGKFYNNDIYFRITQNDVVQEWKLDKDIIVEDAWQTVYPEYDWDKFTTGRAMFDIYEIGSDNTEIGVLFVESNNTKYKPAYINGILQENRHVFLVYNSYNYNDFFKIFSILFAFNIIGISFIYKIIQSWSNIKKYPVTIVAALICLIFICKSYIPNGINIDGWIQAVWLCDYNFGFVNRGFGGTILTILVELLTGSNFITKSILVWFLLLLTIFVTIYVVYNCYKLEKDIESEMYRILLLVFVTSPFFITYYIGNGGNFGRLDIVLIALFLFSVQLTKNNKYIFLLPLISVIGCLTYQIYVICFFPVLFFLMLIYSKGNNVLKINTYVSSVLVIITTIAIKIYGYLDNITTDEYYNYVINRIDFFIDRSVVICYPFIADKSFSNIPDVASNHLIFRFALLWMLFIPVILLFYIPMINYIKNEINNYFDKFIHYGILCSPCSMILILSSSDFQRYFANWFIAFTIVFFSICKNEEKILVYLDEFDKKIRNKVHIYYDKIIIVYMFILGVTQNTSWPFGTIMDAIINGTNRLINHL